MRYHVRRADETDRNVADHIREYGHVTNQALRRLFDLDVAGARALLRALQVRGLLVKLGQGRGGPGIRYGPGPGRWPPMLASCRRSADLKSVDLRERSRRDRRQQMLRVCCRSR